MLYGLHFGCFAYNKKSLGSSPRDFFSAWSLILLNKRLAVGALVHFGIAFMRADLNAVEAAIVIAVAMIHAGRHGAVDAAVCFFHDIDSFLPDWRTNPTNHSMPMQRWIIRCTDRLASRKNTPSFPILSAIHQECSHWWQRCCAAAPPPRCECGG